MFPAPKDAVILAESRPIHRLAAVFACSSETSPAHNTEFTNNNARPHPNLIKLLFIHSSTIIPKTSDIGFGAGNNDTSSDASD